MATRTAAPELRDRSTNRSTPEAPTQLRARSWFGVLRRTVSEFRADNLNNTLATTGYACDSKNVGDVNFATRCPNGVTNLVSWNRATDADINFGQLTGDRGPREIQYALKFTF